LNSERTTPPVWLMGMCNATMGFSNGIVLFALPQLLAAGHIPESKIATITAVAFSPNFWSVFFAPILDVRFSRRWYATVLAAACAICTAITIFSLHHLFLLEILALLATATANLSSSAMGGWFSNITDHKDKNILSKWINISLICGIGVTSMLGGQLVRHLPMALAAVLVGVIVFLPATIFAIIPAPGPDRRLAGESFIQFSREVLSLLCRCEVVIVLFLFLSPCSSFALTNLLGGLGDDFHASAGAISLAGGLGTFIPGVVGCALFPIFARRLPLRFFYLANGVIGSVFTLSLLVVPHATSTFALAMFGEFLFQAVSFSVQIGIVFEAIGPDNPLAATTFSFLTAAANIPVAYMMVADGRAYAAHGIAGSFGLDAAVCIATCLLAGLLLSKFDRRRFRAIPQLTEIAVALQQED
jgi:MFS transporter, PAT family, beta-lactamase induction signal transducer AmpG